MSTHANGKQNGKKRVDISKKGRKSKTRGHWGQSKRANMIEWQHPDIGSIYIELKGFQFARAVHQDGPNTWNAIELGRQTPRKVEIDFTYDLYPDVELIHGHKRRGVVDAKETQPDPFCVEVIWRQAAGRDGDMYPELQKDRVKDFQLYPINKKTGFTVHLDVSIVANAGRLWVTIQEVTGAQIAWHSPDVTIDGLSSVIVGERAYTLVPVYSENCYDGFDPVTSWNKTYPARADHVLGYAAEFGAAQPVEDCVMGEWQPQWPATIPADLAKRGYKKAVVLWYNLTLGFGFAQLESGETCFVHIKSIQDETGRYVIQQGDFPVMAPSRGCYVKCQPGDKGLQATAVRPAERAAEAA